MSIRLLYALPKNKEYRTKSLILCTGARPRFLEVPGEQEYTGKGVSYCATCDGFFFRGKELVVVGGGDSALEEGLFPDQVRNQCEDSCTDGTSCVPARFCRTGPLNNDQIEFVWNSVVTSINGNENGVVSGVNTRDTLNRRAR